MNTLLAARPALQAAAVSAIADTPKTPTISPAGDATADSILSGLLLGLNTGQPMASGTQTGAVAGIPCLGITRDNFMSPTEKAANRISQDIYLTQRILPPMIPRNPSMFSLRLLERVEQSVVALWRNPLQMLIRNWKRRELMHVFNGFFHTATDDPERYDTFSRNVTWPTFEMA